jgi:uncharacterized protein involved in outer membrane biogenesis
VVVGLIVLALLISYVPLSNDEVKEKIINSVAEQTGYQVEVTGSFDFYLSLTPGFEATGIRIFENSQSSPYEIKRLGLNVSLFSLMTDELLVTDLEIEGMEIDGTSQDTGDQPSLRELELPTINDVRLLDIAIRYGESGALFIDDWKFEKALMGNDLQLEGKGTLQGKAYKISSQLGALNQLIAAGGSFPIDATFQYYKTVISLKGSIIDPLGKGELQLDVEAKVPNVSAALATAGIDTSELGQASASAKLTGNFATPALQDLDVKITKGKSILVEAAGAIDNLHFLDEQSIKLKGFVTKDREFFNWLIPGVTAGEGEWQFSGSIVNKKTGLYLTDVQIVGKEPAGYSMSIKGEGLLDNFNARQPFSQLMLDVDFDASQSIARALFNDAIPGMGNLKGRFQIHARSEAALAIEAIDMSTRLLNDIPLTARGKINNFALDDAELVSGIDIDLSLSANDSVKLGQLLEAELPDISPVNASAKLSGTEQQYLVKNFMLKAGTAGKLQLQASGDIRLNETKHKDLIKDVRLKVDVMSADTQSVATALDINVPELGPVKGEFNLQKDAQKLKLTKVNLQSGSADGLQIVAKGEVGRIELEPEFRFTDVQLNITTKASSTASLSPLVEFDVPDFGALQGKGKVLTRDNRIGLHDAEITATLQNNTIINARGRIVDLVELKGISWNVDVDLASDESFNKVLGHSVPGLDAIHGDLLVSDEDGSLGLEEIVISSRQEGLLKMKLNGLLDDLNNRNKMDVSADVATSNLKVIGSLLGQRWPDTKPAKLNGWFRVNGNKTNFDGSLLVGETAITADISGLDVSPRVKINGYISTQMLHLADFGLLVSEPKQEEPKRESTTGTKKEVSSDSTDEKIFSEQPFSLEWMKQVDLDMKIKVADVADTEAKLESFDIPLQIKDGGILIISPARVDYEGGAIKLDFKIDATSGEARTALKLETDDLPLDRLAVNLGVQEKISGSIDLIFELDTKGNSPATMASNLNGVIEFGVEDMEAPKERFDLLTKNLFGWVVSSTMLSRRTKLDCGMMIFEANQGQLASKLVFFDGSNLTLSGDGSLDLGQETIDFYIIPKEKRSLLSNASPVHLTGPLRDPDISAISTAEMSMLAAKGYASLAILPTITIPVAVLGSLGGLFAQDKSKGDNSACLKYLQDNQ